jgi:hypothetical protein
MSGYHAEPKYMLNPLSILDDILEGSAKITNGIEIVSNGTIALKATRQSDVTTIDILPPEPSVIVTKFLKFKATLDYLKITKDSIIVKGANWPELTVDRLGIGV